MGQLVKSNWRYAILICDKCSKKVDGGFGPKGKTSLIKSLRAVMGKGRKASVGVVPVKCLGVCPKNAITVIDTSRPQEWMIVKARTPIEDVVRVLGHHSRGSGADQRDHVGDALRPV